MTKMLLKPSRSFLLMLFGAAVCCGFLSEARAQCSYSCDTGASPSYCNFDCPTSADYIVFGSVWTYSGGTWSWAGIGVVRFATDSSYARGAYQDRTATWTNVTDYRVRADGAGGSTSSDDLVRLADPDCEYFESNTIKVCGDLPDAADTFLFWGDAGEDRLLLCSYVPSDIDDQTDEPAAGDCSDHAGRADGRSGADYVLGSTNDDYLWGGTGADHVFGFAGTDYLYGGDDVDHMYGGTGSDEVNGDGGGDMLYGDNGADDDLGSADVLYGGAGYDALYGEAGCDYLYRGPDGSYCQCGYEDLDGEGFDVQTCTVTDNCPGCFGRSESGESADEPDPRCSHPDGIPSDPPDAGAAGADAE